MGSGGIQDTYKRAMDADDFDSPPERRTLVDLKRVKMERVAASYDRKLAELYFMETQGTVLDYPNWLLDTKKSTALITFMRSRSIDLSDERWKAQIKISKDKPWLHSGTSLPVKKE
ncbi:hypothetical protein SARC_14725, partial [Sphaeroforma arctica JP610]